MVIISASLGPRGGANVLKVATESAPFFGGDIKAGFSVGPFPAKFDNNAGVLTDPALSTTLRKALNILQEALNS